MESDKFDAVVVGAGMAGNAAALKLARAGLQVVLIERGPFPGSKNLSGGVLYGRILDQLIPKYWEEAPVERYINNEVITFMTGDASFNIDFKTQAFSQPPYNGFTVLRAKFDRWMSGKAEEAGAVLATGIKVDKVLQENGQVVGIVAGDEVIRADVVIAADGANSFLAQDAGLRGRLPNHHVAVGVKELIGLPHEVIEERFHLTGHEGVAYAMVGFATRGVAGGGFLYTNEDSLSLGLVIQLDKLLESRLNPADILDEFLEHPMLAPLIKDGILLEYGAHLVPEGGVDMMPRLYTGGMLVAGDAAGLTINNGFVVRGMDLAIGSGIAAAEAVLEARDCKDFSAQSLSVYQTKLDRSFVMADMRTYSRATHFMQNERLFTAYPEMLANLMTRIYTQQSQPKPHLMPELLKSLQDSHVSFFDLGRDALNGVRSL
ncbi:MAG: FAD-dependent oxidoreductase [Anaerolineaceae bacterium]|nr:FAD-dependent oxidoreductase [Anaerolineaceae bacterium]